MICILKIPIAEDKSSKIMFTFLECFGHEFLLTGLRSVETRKQCAKSYFAIRIEANILLMLMVIQLIDWDLYSCSDISLSLLELYLDGFGGNMCYASHALLM